MTLDGYCDHTAIIPDEELHQHYTDLLHQGSAILYGRITYELMTFWLPLARNPSGYKPMDDFAEAIDTIPKIVFSTTIKDVAWDSARLASRSIEDEILELRKQQGNPVFLGSRSITLHLMKLNLIDEYQFCVQPVIAGKGLPLFENVNDRKTFSLIKTKVFKSGAVIFYYEPSNIGISEQETSNI